MGDISGMRGSDALRRAWKERGAVLDDATVEAFAAEFEELEAVQVSLDGGDRPHSIGGTFVVDDPDRCGTTVSRLLGSGLAVQVRVFPRGIPWPDQFHLEAVLGRNARH
jgi:ferric-dicitrate binding protein FerR (iron transport regulator)